MSGNEKDTGKKEEENKSSTLRTVLAVTAILLVFGLTFYLVYKGSPVEADQPEYYMYNDFAFVKQGSLWVTQVQQPGSKYLYTIPLHYGPRDLTEVGMIGVFSQDFADANYVYITIDPDQIENTQDMPEGEESHISLAAAELSLVLSQAIQRNPIAACSRNESEACSERPIARCEEDGEPVIYLQEEGDAMIYFNGDCIYLNGEGPELVKAVDRLLLYWLGVMRN